MDRQKLLYALAGLALGALASYYFANRANGGEIERLRSELARTSRTQPEAGAGAAGGVRPQDQSQAEAQVRELIAGADANPSDSSLQRRAGEQVYRHALTTQQSALLAEAVRLLRRAHEGDPKNYDTLLLLGNSHLTLGLAGDPQSFTEARGYYVNALAERPGDVNGHTLLGMTYYYGRPADPQSAAREYRKALDADPRHEMALQNLASALLATGALDEATRRVGELEKVNPANGSLGELRAKLQQARGGVKGGE